MALTSQVADADRAPVPPVYWSHDVEGTAVDSIPDASDEFWRAFGIGVCDYAITHGLTRQELNEALTLFGVLEDESPRIARSPTGKQRPARGRCPACKRMQAVALDGRMYKHPSRAGDEDCDGSYDTPVAEPQTVAS
jgi:hypothetical protein